MLSPTESPDFRSFAGVLVEHLSQGVVYCKLVYSNDVPVDWEFLYVNSAFSTHTGLTPRSGQRVSDFLPGIHQSDPHVVDIYQRVANGGTPERHEIYIAALKRWLLVNTFSPAPQHFVSIVQDITTRKQDIADRLLADRVFDFANTKIITDSNGIILRVNKSFTETTGYTSEESVGIRPGDLLRSGQHNKQFYREMWDTLHQTGSWEGEVLDRNKNGTIYPAWLSITAVRDNDGNISHYIGSQQDLAKYKTAEARLRTLECFDPLTLLFNRSAFLERVTQLKSDGSKSYCGLLLIDLDRFRKLTSRAGSQAGEDLLKLVAKRIVQCVREHDIVASPGKDTFSVLLTQLGLNEDEAARSASRIADEIHRAIRRDSAETTASIGITVFCGNSPTALELLQQAELAMTVAKDAGRNTSRFYDPALSAASARRAALERELWIALEDSQFLLHYQAQVDQTGNVTGAEALVRWQHPSGDLILPGRFIPLAEDSGLILPLGSWVLEAACMQLAKWAAQPDLAHLKVSVNISAEQIHQPDFIERVQHILRTTRVRPAKLKFELTESLLAKDLPGIVSKMAALRSLGAEVALDDFGTGYSSLSYLKKLPITQLKIDQSFVQDVLIDSHDAAIARTVIALAQELGLNVIAEGVETAEQRDFLASIGCRDFQGYLFSRPLPLDEFERFAQRLRLDCAKPRSEPFIGRGLSGTPGFDSSSLKTPFFHPSSPVFKRVSGRILEK